MLQKSYINGVKSRLLSELATDLVMAQVVCYQVVVPKSTAMDARWLKNWKSYGTTSYVEIKVPKSSKKTRKC